MCSHGHRMAFYLVASNADVVHTYGNLLAGEPWGIQDTQRLQSKRFSMSLFVIHFELKNEHPDLRHHVVRFGARYRELIHDIFHGHELADGFSFYLHLLSVTDASLAPPTMCSRRCPFLATHPSTGPSKAPGCATAFWRMLSNAVYRACGLIC